MFATRGVIVVLLIYIYLSNTNSSKARKKQGFEARLENVHECKNPSPPYIKKFTIIPKYTIDIVNGTRYLSGNTTVLAPTQFLNFSGRSFAVDSAGKRLVKFQISQVSCRNFFAKAIIKFSNMTFSSNNCMLHKVKSGRGRDSLQGDPRSGIPISAVPVENATKGFFRYDNMNFNKIMHAIPVWHSPGDVIHELQLVTDGATDFCSEIKVKITE